MSITNFLRYAVYHSVTYRNVMQYEDVLFIIYPDATLSLLSPYATVCWLVLDTSPLVHFATSIAPHSAPAYLLVLYQSCLAIPALLDCPKS